MNPVKLRQYRAGIIRANEHYEFFSFVRKNHPTANQMDVFWAWQEWDLDEDKLTRRGTKAYILRFSHLRTRDIMEALS